MSDPKRLDFKELQDSFLNDYQGYCVFTRQLSMMRQKLAGKEEQIVKLTDIVVELKKKVEELSDLCKK
jgi:hypothetical protein